mmetsp:Transcript_100193/g.259046  ORF Transcript_100193/g.259046 Transcript_100193/m.259046 type:complete len:243 (+) Transcript_100193:173-901(+)
MQPHAEHKKGGDSKPEDYPHSYKYPRPGLTADTAVFRIGSPGDPECQKLYILLIKRKRSPYQGDWALPGGFVDEHEDIETAAAREVEEETGISGLKLYEVGAFGMPRRDPRGHTVTICYMTVISAQLADTAKAGDDAADTSWSSVEDLPALAFDHAEILRACLRKVARGITMGDTDITRYFHEVGCEGQAMLTIGRCASNGCFLAAQAWAEVAPERTKNDTIVARAKERLEEARRELPPPVS